MFVDALPRNAMGKVQHFGCGMIRSSPRKRGPRAKKRKNWIPAYAGMSGHHEIAVLGGGNGSFAAAGDMALAGHEVRLWRRDAEAVKAHNAAGGIIIVKDFRGRHEAKPSLVTNDIAAAVRDAELILCPAPATAQPDIARALAPHLTDGQVVFLPPGTFGSFIFAKTAHDAGNRADVAFAETGTLPWLTRKHGPFEVAITIRAKRLPTGVFPLTRKEHALAVIGRAFPGVIEDCGDALSGALMNAGPIIHPPLIVMNAAPLEHFDALGHPQGGHASLPCAASPTRSMRSASRCARRSAMARRTSRSPTTTRRTARSGCTAAARTTSSPTRATGASTSC